MHISIKRALPQEPSSDLHRKLMASKKNRALPIKRCISSTSQLTRRIYWHPEAKDMRNGYIPCQTLEGACPSVEPCQNKQEAPGIWDLTVSPALDCVDIGPPLHRSTRSAPLHAKLPPRLQNNCYLEKLLDWHWAWASVKRLPCWVPLSPSARALTPFLSSTLQYEPSAALLKIQIHMRGKICIPCHTCSQWASNAMRKGCTDPHHAALNLQTN